MEGTLHPAGEQATALEQAAAQLRRTAVSMGSWLKFLGIVSIVSGALLAFTIIGLIFAWLPIWLGVLLFQAGDRANRAEHSDDLAQVADMMEKLRSYFVIYAIVTIISLSFSIMSIAFMATLVPEVVDRLPEILDAY